MKEYKKNALIAPDKTALLLLKVLQSQGIDLPLLPNTSNTQQNRWLIRGEPNKQRLLRNENFYPQYTIKGVYGVFLFDCIMSSFCPNPGVYYLLNEQKLNNEWIVRGSSEYQKLFHYIARKLLLDVKTKSGKKATRLELYKNNSVYQPEKGLVTMNLPVSLSAVDLILITEFFFSHDELSRLSPEIKAKSRFFSFE